MCHLKQGLKHKQICHLLLFSFCCLQMWKISNIVRQIWCTVLEMFQRYLKVTLWWGSVDGQSGWIKKSPLLGLDWWWILLADKISFLRIEIRVCTGTEWLCFLKPPCLSGSDASLCMIHAITSASGKNKPHKNKLNIISCFCIFMWVWKKVLYTLVKRWLRDRWISQQNSYLPRWTGMNHLWNQPTEYSFDHMEQTGSSLWVPTATLLFLIHLLTTHPSILQK